tara:strand:- start:511 stop:1251 length:741 start_codon:yes stop_codon:yes gene_type:complete
MIIANWKCNGNKQMIFAWFEEFVKNYIYKESSYIGIAPPTIYLEYVKRIISEKSLGIKLGTQDLDASSGAMTGAISAEMILDYECNFSIVGHSERRQYFDEKNSSIKEKIHKLIDLATPILCVGETFEENKNNLTKEVIYKQLRVLEGLNFQNEIVIAYEPVWAIGTGKTPLKEEVNEIHKFIKDVVQSSSINSLIPQVLYGGSVSVDNCKDFFNCEFVDGALIGGASLEGASFANIVKSFNGSYK